MRAKFLAAILSVVLFGIYLLIPNPTSAITDPGSVGSAVPVCTLPFGKCLDGRTCQNSGGTVATFPTTGCTTTGCCINLPSCKSKGGTCTTAKICKESTGTPIYNTSSCYGSTPTCCKNQVNNECFGTGANECKNGEYCAKRSTGNVCLPKSYSSGSSGGISTGGTFRTDAECTSGGGLCRITCPVIPGAEYSDDKSTPCASSQNKCCVLISYIYDGCSIEKSGNYCRESCSWPYSEYLDPYNPFGQTPAFYKAALGTWYYCGGGVSRYNIAGVVFLDTVNINGIKDSGELGLPGAIITLSGRDPGTTTSYIKGDYIFRGLRTGTNTVRFNIPPGYRNTTAASVNVRLGPSAANVNFGIAPTNTISGNVFVDTNGNGKKDCVDVCDDGAGDEQNYKAGGITITSNSGKATPDPTNNGKYTVTDLLPGTFVVSYASLPTGFETSVPKNGPPPSFSVTVGPSCSVLNNDQTGASCSGNNVTDLNFAIKSGPPWVQTYGFDVRFDDGYTNLIPANPAYPPYASVTDNTFVSQTLTPYITCTSTGQLCTPIYTQTIYTESVLTVNYSITSAACASGRIHMYVDGTEKTVSGWLGWPGANTSPFNSYPLSTGYVNLGPLSRGTHTLGLQVEGQIGGCDTVGVYSWTGSVVINTSQ